MKRLFLAFLMCIGLVGIASAGPVFNFFDSFNPNTGTMSYNGTTASISGMPILGLTVTGAPLHNGSYFIDGPIACAFSPTGTCGQADTTTGAINGTTLNIVNFGAGGNLTLSGSVDLASGTEVIPFGPIIDSGTYANASLNTSTLTLTTSGVGTDTKDLAFLSYFGITNQTFSFGISANANAPAGYTAPGTFSNASLQGGTITNTPEPSALLLLGTGLLISGGVLRRKLIKQD